LYNYADSKLQSALEASIRSQGLYRKLAAQKNMSLCVVDLSQAQPRYAQINGEEMLYAASLPKIAILLAAYESFEDGTLKETPAIQDYLNDMIRVSSNVAATKMIDLMGMGKINAVLASPKYALYDPNRGGGLWVGKRYAQGGARYPDPITHISHGASATQVCRFYYLLANHKIINEKRSNQMLDNLVDPGLHHKFVNSLDQLAPDATIYRKSGTWKTWHADSVLVQDDHWRNYILVALVNNRNGENIMRSLVPMVERILHPSGNRRLYTLNTTPH
jgi:beta-lactamase class A